MPSQKTEGRFLDAIGRELFAPFLRPDGLSKTVRLVGWDAEQGLCLTLERRGVLLLFEFEPRDECRPCYARTARFNVCVRRQFEATVPLDAPDRRLADKVIAAVARRELLLPEFARPTTSRNRSIREIRVDRLLMPEGAGHYYINPYVGCTIGCEFCYAAERADLSRQLEGLPHLPWGHYVDVKINAAQVLAREVRTAKPGIVRMSPILTDPYQPIERHYRITRQCIEVLWPAGFVPAILTRAARVIDDLDLLHRFERACVGFSIPSDDDRMRQIFEPGGDPIEDRLSALRACRQSGLLTVALIQPLLPLDVDRLVALVAPHVFAVRVDRMYQPDRMQATYEAHGLQAAAGEAYFAQTAARLQAAFRARGVLIDEMDNLVQLLDRAPADFCKASRP